VGSLDAVSAWKSIPADDDDAALVAASGALSRIVLVGSGSGSAIGNLSSNMLRTDPVIHLTSITSSLHNLYRAYRSKTTSALSKVDCDHQI
jgi:hypothetical protein